MGLEEVQDYANKLKKAEKMRDAREQVCLGPFLDSNQTDTDLHRYLFPPGTTEASDSTYL